MTELHLRIGRRPDGGVFYAEQRGGKFASTSQINPMVYRESAFEKVLMAGE